MAPGQTNPMEGRCKEDPPVPLQQGGWKDHVRSSSCPSPFPGPKVSKTPQGPSFPYSCGWGFVQVVGQGLGHQVGDG